MHIERRSLDRPLSQKKLDANRRNALKSSGPTSSRGRAISSQNARKYTILPFEDPDLPKELTAQYYGHYIPADKSERRLVDILVHCDRVRRNCKLLLAFIRAHGVIDLRTQTAAKVPPSVAGRLSEIKDVLRAADSGYYNALIQLESTRAQAAA